MLVSYAKKRKKIRMKKQTRPTFIKTTAIVTGTAMATPSLTFSIKSSQFK